MIHSDKEAEALFFECLSQLRNKPKLIHRTAKSMGRPLTGEEMVENLLHALCHCTKCGAYNALEIPVCETCGNELSEHGKQ